MYWYLKVLRLYADFEGRARRKEFWMFTLFNLIFLFVAALLDELLGTQMGDIGIFESIYGLVVIIPQFAVSVRRLHDIGISGLYNLVALIPFIGWFVLFFLFCQDSQFSRNRWGENPKMRFKSDFSGSSYEHYILNKTAKNNFNP